MKNTSVQSLLKPNIASVGFGLFLSICAIGVWGGVFPFLPAEIQTEQMLLAFFIAQATTFTLSFFLGAVNTYYFPRPRVQVLVASMGIPLFIGWLCLIGILYLESYALALVIIGGVLLGFGSAGFFVLWHDIFASEPNEVGERELLVGSIYSPLFYVLFYLINQEIIMWVVTFVLTPLLCICVLVKAKDFNRAQPMFEDAPLSLPRIYRQVMQDFWRSALALGGDRILQRDPAFGRFRRIDSGSARQHDIHVGKPGCSYRASDHLVLPGCQAQYTGGLSILLSCSGHLPGDTPPARRRIPE